MLDQLCIGWTAPAHLVIRVQTVEVAGIATLNLCPLCLFCLNWDPLMKGAVELVDASAMGGADGIVFAWSYLTPPTRRP